MNKVNGTKYKVYVGNSENKEFLCCVDSIKDVSQILENIKPYYIREMYQLGYLIVDYGSWTNFLYIEMTQEEFDEEIKKEI